MGMIDSCVTNQATYHHIVIERSFFYSIPQNTYTTAADILQKTEREQTVPKNVNIMNFHLHNRSKKTPYLSTSITARVF